MKREKRVFKIEDFKQCPKCQSRVLYKDKDQFECGNCGLVLSQDCCYTKQGDIMDEQSIEKNLRQKRDPMY